MRSLTLLCGYVATVVAANIVTSNYGLIPAGLGLLVPAGSYLAGLTLTARDALHHLAGARLVWLGVAAGITVSVLASDGRIALASGAAFAVSELLDLAVYSKLRRRGWRRALIASNAVGAVVDTALFLQLSGFGVTTQAMTGQVLVKAVWVTGVALLFTEAARRAVSKWRSSSSELTSRIG